MSQINPNKIIEQGIFKPSKYSKVQQVGIDVSLKLDSDSHVLALRPRTGQSVEINESVDIPENVYADLTIRSSLSRKLVFQSSGKYDPGFKGVCGLTLYNMSDDVVRIEANARIAQMVFYTADSASTYDGHYNHSGSIESQYEKEITV